MRNATRVTVSTVGALVGLGGLEHGIGEILQGNHPPEGMMILSWPESALFRVLVGEPAMTIIPNLFVTGILAILFSLIFLVWATMFVQRKNGGLVLILLSIFMLLAGGGFAPPMFGIILGVAATRINKPLTWWRARFSMGLRRVLGELWPWFLACDLVSWLLLLPGSILFDYFFGVSNPELVIAVLSFSVLGFLLLAILAAFARDSQRHTSLRQAPSMLSGQPVSQASS